MTISSIYKKSVAQEYQFSKGRIINDLVAPTESRSNKAFAGLRNSFALQGQTWRSCERPNAITVFIVSRWVQSWHLTGWADVMALFALISGGAA